MKHKFTKYLGRVTENLELGFEENIFTFITQKEKQRKQLVF